jgi:glycerol-3-phosphate dehydrogenase
VAKDRTVDLLIVGGGVNGAGIARDAAGRGLAVLLCERGDLASATSSASTKLIHGGLRYLEYYEFHLVRHALREREVLLRAAPHIIWPLRFVLPHSPEQRPAWLIRLGLFLYDHLGGRKLLPGSAAIDLRHHPAGAPLKAGWRKAFVYSDCWVQDARLVVLNALDAAEHGAEIRTRTEFVAGRPENGLWRVELKDLASGRRDGLAARALVNAAGPWVTEVLAQRLGSNLTKRIRNVKGSHIVVPRLFDHPYPYIFQNPDKRIVFAIPYEERFTLIGTTDVDYPGDPAQAAITEAEVRYLCDSVNRYFERAVAPRDVVWSYAGVRPLFDDEAGSAAAATRDYVLELENGAGEPPLLNVYGGKITTFRLLAEQALARLGTVLPVPGAAWTATAPLPGGDIAGADFAAFVAAQRGRYPWLPAALVYRYARNYGTRMADLIGAAQSLDDLGRCFGGDLYEAEVRYLTAREFAVTAEDILWRRSKLGLHLPSDTPVRLQRFLDESTGGAESEVARA